MYSIIDQPIPQLERQSINNKIIQLIDSGTVSIPKEIIFNSYTGIGGLHGLEFKDYDSYNEYSSAKKEIENGQFFTPHSLCKSIVDLLQVNNSELVADLCCGSGNFINWLPIQSNFFGCEIDEHAVKVAKYLYPDANIQLSSILYYDVPYKFDVIVGNPPFNLRWQHNDNAIVSQHFFVQKCAELLKPGGILSFIAPSSYLNDDFYCKEQISFIDEHFNFVFQSPLHPKSFNNLGITHFETKLIVLQKASQYIEHTPFIFNEFAPSDFDYLSRNFIIPLRSNLEKIKPNLLLDNTHASNINNFSFSLSNYIDTEQYVAFGPKRNTIAIKPISSDNALLFKLNKYLFELKSHKHLASQYARAKSLIHRYESQERPLKMSQKEWDETRITLEHLVDSLKRFIINQNRIEQDKIRLVKSNYAFKLKGYSKKCNDLIKTYAETSSWHISSAVHFNNIDLPTSFGKLNVIQDENYKRILPKKLRDFQIHFCPILDQPVNPEVSKFITDFSFFGRNKQVSYFDDIQRSDLNMILNRRVSLLNWQMGTGKTPSGYAWSYYNMFFKRNVKFTFIVSGATAIYTTWTDWMRIHNQNFTVINNTTQIKDIFAIPCQSFILISTDFLKRHKKTLHKFVKLYNYKVSLVFDESDEMTNYYSQTTQATLAIFRKVPYKLLTTGTATRNNAGEIYGQIELLYNNSYLLFSNCTHIYKEIYITAKESLDKKPSKLIKEFVNKNYQQPFPAYKGFNLFKYSFNPTKKSVLGIQKNNQDIYNVHELNSILDYTVIVRTFKEMAGEKYLIKQINVQQTELERFIYKDILINNQSVISQFFDSTGNARKDSALRIIRLINLLIKACSTPQVFPKYNTSELPSKTNKIMNMLSQYTNEQVAIGCTTHSAISQYYDFICNHFPMRQIYVITGKETQALRKKRISDFKSSFNGILLCTQQSLKNSVNIPSCNHVIVESLQWNIPKIEQWYFRFIRRDQSGFTNVYFLTNTNTIENNLLALLMSKETINDMIKQREYKQNSEILSEFDLDESIFTNALSKAYDEDGHLYLTWGSQSVN